jgi:hypothetical protein
MTTVPLAHVLPSVGQKEGPQKGTAHPPKKGCKALEIRYTLFIVTCTYSLLYLLGNKATSMLETDTPCSSCNLDNDRRRRYRPPAVESSDDEKHHREDKPAIQGKLNIPFKHF